MTNGAMLMFSSQVISEHWAVFLADHNRS